MMRVTAVLSMIHEPAAMHSGTRLFRGRPVLWWTLQRLKRCASLAEVAVLCWADQVMAVQPVANEQGACVLLKDPRAFLPQVEAVSAARRWADGWRGGLLSTCEFDRGFHAPWVAEVVAQLPCDAVVLVDPAAGLVDGKLIDALVAHAEPLDAPLVFSQAAPGLSGVLLRPALLGQLASLRTHPGRFLHYVPEQPCRDPISEPHCAPVPTPVARTTHRFTLDTNRQVQRLSHATVSLNGALIGTEAEQLVRVVGAFEPFDELPREVVLELTTRRATRPIFLPTPEAAGERADLTLATAERLFAELAAADDIRLTLGGVGDPLLSPAFFEIAAAARAAGIAAIHLRTDLFGLTPDALDKLAAAAPPVDVISVQIPAVSAAVYLAVMGVDGCARVLANVRELLTRRGQGGGATPIVVPVFTKCRQNLAEMEIWYDKWLRALGSAVIAGPSDFAGQIADHAVADMAPPLRRPCARLASRMSVLSDGRIVTCEQDFAGRRSLGTVGVDRVADVWQSQFGGLRADHRRGEWAKHPTCGPCREWHRP